MALDTGMKMIKTEKVTVENAAKTLGSRKSFSIRNSCDVIISGKDSSCFIRWPS